MMEYERLTGKVFAPENTVTSEVTIHYCCLVSGGSMDLSMSQFADALDDAETKSAIDQAFVEEVNRWSAGRQPDTGEAKKK